MLTPEQSARLQELRAKRDTPKRRSSVLDQPREPNLFRGEGRPKSVSDINFLSEERRMKFQPRIDIDTRKLSERVGDTPALGTTLRALEGADEDASFIEKTPFIGTGIRAGKGLMTRLSPKIEEIGERTIEEAAQRGDTPTLSDDAKFVGRSLLAGMGEAGKALGETIIGGLFDTAKLLLPKSAEKFIADVSKEAIEDLAKTDVGQTAIKAFSAGKEMYDRFAQDNPDTALAFESAVGILDGLGFSQAGKKVITKTADTLSGIKDRIKKKRDSKGSEAATEDLNQEVTSGRIERAEAQKIAAEMGIDLPAAAISGDAASFTERILSQGFFGGRLRNKFEKAVDKFSEVTNSISDKAKSDADLGGIVSTKIDELTTAYDEMFDTIYDGARQVEREGRETIKFSEQTHLDKKLKREILDLKSALSGGLSTTPRIKEFEALLKGERSFRTMNALKKEFAKRANFKKKFDRTEDERMWGSFYDKARKDLDKAISDSIPELGDMISEANKEFSGFKKIQARPFFEKIVKLAEDKNFDKISDIVSDTKVSANEIDIMFDVVGDDIKDQIRDKVISNIITKSQSASGGFTPGGFAVQMKNIGKEKLDAMFSPEQVDLLLDLNKVNKAIHRAGFTGSRTAAYQGLTKYITGFVGIAGSAVSFPVAVFSIGSTMALEYGLVRMIASPKGQAFLKRVSPNVRDALSKLPKILRKQREVIKNTLTKKEINERVARAEKMRDDLIKSLKDKKAIEDANRFYGEKIKQLKTPALPAPKVGIGKPDQKGTIQSVLPTGDKPIRIDETVEKARTRKIERFNP